MIYTIKLDRERILRYGMRAISLIEKKFKKPISQINFDNLTMEETAIFIWAGLAHEDKNLTPDRVMDLVDHYSNLHEVMNAVAEAFSGAFPTESGEEEKN